MTAPLQTLETPQDVAGQSLAASPCSPWLDSVLCGDNVQILSGLPSDSIDLVVTSPPYDDLRTYGGHTWDFEGLAKELTRVMKPGGVIVWVVADATINGSETLTSMRQVIHFKDVCGLRVHDTMIYEKSGCGACGSNKCYIQNFEYMFIFTKGKINTFNLIYDRENKEVGKQTVNSNRNKFTADTGRKYREIETQQFGRRFNIWKYNQTSGHDQFSKSHPAPFPQDLAQDHIISWSNEGDVVLDPFAGSGTTCLAARDAGRRYVGIEINAEYVEIINRRLGLANAQAMASADTKTPTKETTL